MLDAFKAKKITALTNANILTTGFDAPDTDLVAMLRPTMSPALYVQMAGRGLRPKSHTDHCIVLDFAENVARHGPITAVEPPRKKGTGEAPVKVCPGCQEILGLSTKVCPECGHIFETVEQEKKWTLSNDDIMGDEGVEMYVSAWRWERHTSRASGKEMVKVRYYGDLSDPPVTEYLPILHEGFGGNKAIGLMAYMSSQSGADDARTMMLMPLNESMLNELCDCLNRAKKPAMIEYIKDGKYHRVVRREWNAEAQRA
jgi:DNA repair protein RadD